MLAFPPSERYEVVRLIGAGATSRVYEVLDRRRNEAVALKLLTDGGQADLAGEFEILRHLDHPMLARVYDIGALDGIPYLTQRLIGGEAPGQWCAGDPARVASVGAQVAWALAFVHGHGVAHLDVKPSNVRVEEGRAVLLDFGLARRGAAAGARGGTPAFVAPEVLTGEDYDQRADLYSLGATLYELLAGRPPFVGRHVADVVQQVLFRRPLPVGDLARDCPPALGEIVMRLLARDPTERPPPREVTRLLAGVEGVSLPLLPPGQPGRIGREAELERLREPGVVVLRGPPGVGRRYLMQERLREAQLEGLRTAVGAGRGLDGLESALRAAGAPVRVTGHEGASPADRRLERTHALLGAIEPNMVLGVRDLEVAGEAPVRGTLIIVTEAPGEDGVTLAPLTSREVRRFLEGARPGIPVSNAEVERAVRRTGGLPGRLAVYVVDPEANFALDDRIGARTPDERHVLQGLALIPRPATAGELAGVVGAPPHAALVGLAAAGLAVRTTGGWAPSPPELREILSREPAILLDEAQPMAARAAALAPSLGAARLAGDPEALAAALSEAAASTLELDRRRRLLEELFELEGDLETGLRLEKTLDELGLREPQAGVLARLPESPEVLVRRAFHAVWTARYDEASALAERARQQARDPSLQARAHRARGLAAQHQGDLEAAAGAFAAARALLPDAGDDPALRAHTVHDLGVTALYRGRYAEAMPCFREALRIKLELGDRTGARITRQNLGICHESLGQPRLALRSYEAALAEAGELRSPRGEAWNHMALGGLLRRMGRDEAARGHLDAAEALAERLSWPHLVTGIATERALQGGSRAELRRAEDALREEGDGYNADRLALARLAEELTRGEATDEPVPGAESFPERHAALAALATLRRGETPPPLPDGADPLLDLARAEALRATGRSEEAERVLLDALDRTWAVDDRALLQRTLGRHVATDHDPALEVLELTRTLNSEADLEAVLQAVLDVARRVTGAERSALLLVQGEEVAREASAPGPVETSRGVLLEVVRTNEPVLLADARGAEHLAADRSIADLGLRSVLCVPLRSRERTPHGGLYLDHRSRAGVFGAREVRLVELIAEQAALALATRRLVARAEAQAEELRRVNASLAEGAESARRELASTRLLLEVTRSELNTRFPYPGVIGRSRALRNTLELLDKVIPTRLSVLLEGESGTGKELLARAIHDGGPRAGRPFVAVDCGAVPPTLFESAFFGHVRGAFTGAERDRAGYLALADGGTLFLDEIGELPLEVQAKLLRALETGAFWPVGGTAERRSDVRVVAATNRDLEAMIAGGSWRRDLFYRLAHVRVPVPPLRERPEDIPLLVDHFVGGASISSEAVVALVSHDWPGNIRELRNEIERAVALSAGETISPDHLSPATRGPSRAPAARLPKLTGDLKTYLDDIERRVVAEAMERHEGNITRAADALGVSRYGLRKKLARLGLDDP